MPYIKKESRKRLDEKIDVLIRQIGCSNEDEIEGVLNYCITRICCVMGDNGWRYKYINRILGVLEAVKMEFYSRVATIYEDQCVEINGDLKEYENCNSNKQEEKS